MQRIVSNIHLLTLSRREVAFSGWVLPTEEIFKFYYSYILTNI